MAFFAEDGGLERLDGFPIPEGFYGGVSTRTLQITAEGAAYVINKAVLFNRVIARATTGGIGRAIYVALYQAPNGGDGIADLKFLISGFSAATGNWVMPPDDAQPAILRAGICYALYCRVIDDVAAIMRTYVGGSMDLVTANVDSGTHPLVFTVPSVTEGA